MRLRRQGPSRRLLCEQVPPPAWAYAIRVLGLAEATTICANRWPRARERAPLPQAQWRCSTPALAAAWRAAGAAPETSLLSWRAAGDEGEAARLGKGDQRRVILWAGPWLMRGAARSMLWTFDIFAYLEPGAELLLAGVGPGEPGLREFAAGLAPRSRIRFRSELTEGDWRAIRVAWVNDSTAAVPDLWAEAHARGIPCVAAQQHAATGYLPVAHAPLRPHDPPGWAKATHGLWTAARFGHAVHAAA